MGSHRFVAAIGLGLALMLSAASAPAEGNGGPPAKQNTRDTIGPSMHEADLYRLLDGKTLADLLEWRKHDGVGAAPAVALGGMLDSHDLTHQVWLRKNFTPGRYVLGCVMPMSADAKSGIGYATHTDAGMVMAFEIAE